MGLAGLSVLIVTAGWALYQHPSIGWRVDVWSAELRGIVFPHPVTLPTAVAMAAAPTARPTLVPTAARSTAVLAPPTIAPSPTPSLPLQTTLSGFEHQYQKFNNCGPATLTTTLSYFGRLERQDEAAAFLKPDSKDRNVSPGELSAYVHYLGLEATVRVGGSLTDLKRLIASGFPVMVEKGFEVEDIGWMGHYLLLTGYDDTQSSFIAQDSYLGPDQQVTYDILDGYWRQFNRLFIVVYPADAAPEINALLGPEDPATMYAAALADAQSEAALNPADAYAWFNLGTSLVALARYEEAAAAYDQARVAGLPWRMLWYQFDPYQAYFAAGRYAEVLALADATLAGQDNLEESHYWRGLALAALGQASEARREFEIALDYNPNFAPARTALDNIP